MDRARLLALAALGLAVLIPARSSALNGRPPSLSAESVLLLDPDGKVIYAKNPDEAHAPASLVKMMTLYLALEDIALGLVQWDEPVRVSRHAMLTPRYRMGLRTGEQVAFRVLLEGVGVASANDAATAVAEHLSNGSEEAFVSRMNLKKFVIYTFLGSLPWCLGLAYVGQKLGEQWDTNPTLKTLFHRFDFVIGIAILLAAIWWVWRHLKHARS